MGGAVSLQQRCRKALVIRAYNSRPADQTLEEQFSAFSYLKGDGQFYTNADLIKQCLNIGPNDYPWLEPLMQVLSGGNQSSATSSPGKTKAFEMKLEDFLLFLETGTLVSNEVSDKPPPGVRKKAGAPETPPRRNGSSGDFANSTAGTASPGAKVKQFPPVAPVSLDAGGRQSSRSKIVEVLEIDLSSGKIPDGVKIKSDNQEREENEGKQAEDTLEIIIRPVPNSRLASTLPGGAKVVEGNGKQLWRKREIVRQERTVHYTTVEETGEMQELVEKETTQTEVLHMECRDTGEFAHKELTEYEQVETFNEELVNEVRGHEEYVHLKSLEDEFHYMDSNMPPKGGAAGGSGEPEKEAESRDRHTSGQEEAEPKSPHEEDYDHPHDPSDGNNHREAAKGTANASYIFEPSDDKTRPNDWSTEEEEAYKQYCADFKQGEFRFAGSNSHDPEHNDDYLEASVPIVTHSDDHEEANRDIPAVSVPPVSAAAPTTQDSCDTGGYAVVSSDNLDEDLSPVKPVYTSMHDID